MYENCPATSKDTYIVGADILKWKVEQAKTPEERQEWVDKLLGNVRHQNKVLWQ